MKNKKDNKESDFKNSGLDESLVNELKDIELEK